MSIERRRFFYPSEKLAAARRILVLPHPQGESASISNAFHECYLGLMDIRSEDLDETARVWVSQLREFMDTTGMTDTSGRGLWAKKAEGFSDDEKQRVSTLVGELADWFDMSA
jgi:hypothetical protein